MTTSTVPTDGPLGRLLAKLVDGLDPRGAPCTELTPAPELAAGTTIGAYQIVAPLGSGGMATVYRANDLRLGREVAIKVMATAGRPRAMETPDQDTHVVSELVSGARLIDEAQALARLSHPNVVAIYDVGQHGDGKFIAMELVEGRTLRQWLREPHPWREIADVLVAAGRGLVAAHAAGLVHRDFKPENVLIGDDGRVRVADFGIALTIADPVEPRGVVIGTPGYMAPEQILGQTTDARTDQFAFCVTALEALFGDRRTAPVRLRPILQRGLARDPAERHASMPALLEKLDREQQRGKRILTALAIAAVVSAVVAASVAIVMWRSARAEAARQAAAAQHFGQQVERIESGLRQAFMLPLHDTRPDQRAVRRQMDDIGASDPIALSALGRGSLALHDYPAARTRLETAVASGYRPPEVLYALGVTLGALYQPARAEALRIKDTAARDAKLAELHTTLRDPALGYLRARSSAYGDGLIAFYEARFGDAITRAREAFAEAPALYEAKKLEGDVLQEQAIEAQAAGKYADALRASDDAAAAYAIAIDIARSDPALREVECARWRRRLNTEGWNSAQASSPQAVFERAITACEAARVADPEAPGVAEELSNIYGIRGEFQAYHGEDPTPAYLKAAELGSDEVRLAPARASAYATLGLAQVRLGTYQAGHGVDPVALLRAAIATYDQAVAIQPTQSAYNSLGVAWKVVSAYEADPDAALARSADNYRKATELNPKYSYAHNNLGALYMRRAERELMRGADPKRFVDEAIASFQRALAINPNFEMAQDGLGSAYWLTARYAARSGGDPSAAYELAAASWAKTAQLDPNYADGHRNAGAALVERAERARDPALLASARAELAIARAKNQQDPETARWEAEADRVEAALVRAPAALFDHATTALATAETLDPRSPDVFEERARLLLARARWQLANQRPATAEIAGGLAACERALALDKARAQPLALRGELLLLAGDPAHAREAFAAAVAADPLLAKELASRVRD